jgi:NTP pyrophosphatase (non-canonical NTP hydrolase)
VTQELYINGKRIDDKIPISSTQRGLDGIEIRLHKVVSESTFAQISELLNDTIKVELFIEKFGYVEKFIIENAGYDYDVSFNATTEDTGYEVDILLREEMYSHVMWDKVDELPSEMSEPEPVSQQEYVDITRETAVYPDESAVEYLGLGLNDEAGEVAGAIKKYMRGDYDRDEMKERVKSESGDVLWYITRLLDELDMSLDEVRRYNAEKMLERKDNDSIRGDGEGTDR